MQALEVMRDVGDLRDGEALRGRDLRRDQPAHVRIERRIGMAVKRVGARADIAVHVRRLHRERDVPPPVGVPLITPVAGLSVSPAAARRPRSQTCKAPVPPMAMTVWL